MDKTLKIVSIIGILTISASCLFYFVVRPIQKEKTDLLLKEKEKEALEACVKEAKDKNLDLEDTSWVRLYLDVCTQRKL